jgi:hypothetical protein
MALESERTQVPTLANARIATNASNSLFLNTRRSMLSDDFCDFFLDCGDDFLADALAFAMMF